MKKFTVLFALLGLILVPVLGAFADTAVPTSILAQRIANLEGVKVAKVILKVPPGDTLASGDLVTLAGQNRLPPNSIIMRAYGYVKELVVSSNANTVSVGCEATDDLIAAFDPSALATYARREGVPTGSTANSVFSDGCTLKATIGSGASGITAGRLYFFVEYANGN